MSSTHIMVSVSVEQREQIKEDAKSIGLSASAFMRQIYLAYQQCKVEKEKIAETMQQVKVTAKVASAKYLLPLSCLQGDK